jgi:Glycosyltransferase 61
MMSSSNQWNYLLLVFFVSLFGSLSLLGASLVSNILYSSRSSLGFGRGPLRISKAIHPSSSVVVKTYNPKSERTRETTELENTEKIQPKLVRKSDWSDVAPLQGDISKPLVYVDSEKNNEVELSSGDFEDPFKDRVDLVEHKKNSHCWDHFDFGMLQAWGETATPFCTPFSSNSKKVVSDYTTSKEGVEFYKSSSWLTCRVQVDSHLPGPTAPHTLCDGNNILINYNSLIPTQCLDSRPGYKCDGPAVHWQFPHGALEGACEMRPEFVPGAFPRDHLMDLFKSFRSRDFFGGCTSTSDDGCNYELSASKVVLFVARERAEHANPFHATTDFINAFYSLHMTGVIDGISGSRVGMDNVQVVLLDEQEGPFDEVMWHRIFSPKFPVLRASELKARAASVLVPHAVFVPPGYTNMMLAHVSSESECHEKLQLYESYRSFVLAGLGLPASVISRGGIEKIDDPVQITFISRRPYDKFVEHKYMGRQIKNEQELFDAIAALPGVNAQLVDMVQYDLVQQFDIISKNTEVLIGMHGAALTFALYLPPQGAVVEAWPKTMDMWRCFEHLTSYSGLFYARWENPDPSKFLMDDTGDYTIVDVDVFVARVQEAIDHVKRKRQTLIG